MTRTARAPRLSRHLAEPFLQLHPEDAADLGLKPADLARVTSPMGEAILRVLISRDVPKGAPFAPMHWTGETAPAARIGAVIAPATDPFSGQPESKASVVGIEPYRPAWYAFAVATTLFRPDSRYWAQMCTDNGWRAELAGDKGINDWTRFAQDLFQTSGTPEIMTDGAGLTRLAFHHEGRLAAALFAAPEPVAVARDFVAAALNQPAKGILAGRPGKDQPDPGPTICACAGIGRNQILAAIAASGDIENVCTRTGAGTNCGSCRPEIADLIARAKRPEAAE